MAKRNYSVLFSDWDRNELSPLIEEATGLIKVQAYGSGKSVTVEHADLQASHDPAIQAVLDSYDPNPQFGISTEDSHIKGSVDKLRQLAVNTETIVNAWNLKIPNADEKDVILKTTVEQLGLLATIISDLIRRSGLD
jgi:hypothetical protein